MTFFFESFPPSEFKEERIWRNNYLSSHTQEIEAIVLFLPRLYAEGFTPIESRGGGTSDKDDAFTRPWPNYHRDVSEFFRIASSECWCDYDNDPGGARRMVENEDAVNAADLSKIKTMLTYCVRGERFCEGHWGEMIEGGFAGCSN